MLRRLTGVAVVFGDCRLWWLGLERFDVTMQICYRWPRTLDVCCSRFNYPLLDVADRFRSLLLLLLLLVPSMYLNADMLPLVWSCCTEIGIKMKIKAKRFWISIGLVPISTPRGSKYVLRLWQQCPRSCLGFCSVVQCSVNLLEPWNPTFSPSWPWPSA